MRIEEEVRAKLVELEKKRSEAQSYRDRAYYRDNQTDYQWWDREVYMLTGMIQAIEWVVSNEHKS